MNRPSRTDEPQKGDGYNQSPNAFSNDLTTNQDLNGIANARELTREEAPSIQNSPPENHVGEGSTTNLDQKEGSQMHVGQVTHALTEPGSLAPKGGPETMVQIAEGSRDEASGPSGREDNDSALDRVKRHLLNFGKFVGPGFMIAVAYSTQSPHKALLNSPVYTSVFD